MGDQSLRKIVLVWQNEGVHEVSLFICCFRQRLIDDRWQDWKSRTDASDLIFTDILRRIICKQLIFADNYKSNSLIKFSFGISLKAVHSLQCKTYAYIDTICPLCKAAVKNEVHFTLCCSPLNGLGQRLTPDKFYSQSSSFRLLLLTENKVIINNVAIFLYLSFKRRGSCC